MTIRIPVEMKEELAALGQATRRSNSFLAAEAVMDYIAREKAIIESIKQGLDDIQAGRVYAHEDVMRTVRDTIKQARQRKLRRDKINAKSEMV